MVGASPFFLCYLLRLIDIHSGVCSIFGCSFSKGGPPRVTRSLPTSRF
jgi:hypothetical protein